MTLTMEAQYWENEESSTLEHQHTVLSEWQLLSVTSGSQMWLLTNCHGIHTLLLKFLPELSLPWTAPRTCLYKIYKYLITSILSL